jgi:hypothetical protein
MNGSIARIGSEMPLSLGLEGEEGAEVCHQVLLIERIRRKMRQRIIDPGTWQGRLRRVSRQGFYQKVRRR